MPDKDKSEISTAKLAKTDRKVKVRFAPSPTGPFSLGNARTALFNWIYAKHNDGKFLLRIEDTDKERSNPKYEKEILEGLRWLGLVWDDEIYHQSNREEIYKKYLNQLLEENKVYYCFCTGEELEADRQAQLSQGLPPRYSGKCKHIPENEAKTRASKSSAVIRFKMPNGEIEFNDIIRGKVKFNLELIGDIVIAKGLKWPLYNFAVVIDDNEMEITHVIRGEDHLSNTPKQIAIQTALGFETPKYAHLPLILNPDGKKLSKRFLEHSFSDYKESGYLPSAMLNFLLLLGWHPKEDKEVISIEEAVKTFSLKRVQKSGGIFNEEKLDWYNGYYLRHLTADEILPHLKPFIPEGWLNNKSLITDILEVEKERMKKLTDFAKFADFFFKLPDYEGGLLVWKDNKESSQKNLEKIVSFLKEIPDDKFEINRLESFIVELSMIESRGEVYWPFRVALSGKKDSPGALDIAKALGKKEVVRRLEIALKKL